VSTASIADRHLDGTCTRAADGRHCHYTLDTYKINTGLDITCCVTGCGWSTERVRPVEVTQETEVQAADVWEGDEIRLAPGLFVKVTSVEHVNVGTKVHFVKIRTDEGDELLLAPQTVRTVKITFITRQR
jgi:preprotein translocase subunit YajC